MAGEDYNKLFAEAAEIASNVPEAMQDAAFRRALDLLLDGTEGGEKKSGARKSPRAKAKRKPASGAAAGSEQGDAKDRAATLIAELDRTSYPQVSEASTVKDRSLWLLRIAHDEFSIDGLSSSEITKVLTEKFRLNCTRQAVSQALDKASRLVDRDTRGTGVRYRIMDPGEKYLDNPDSEEGKARTSQAKRPKAKKARPANASGAKTVKAKAKTGKSTKPKKGRPTPFTVLEDLVATGFFQTPQTISMIREHMEQKQGRKYKANELSPALLRLLRNEKLTRAKNDDKQYEYSSN